MSGERENMIARLANVLEWGYTTGPNHPDATFEGLAEQVLKVIAHDGSVVVSAADVEKLRGRCQLIIETRADRTLPSGTIDGLTAEQLAYDVIRLLEPKP